MRQFNTEQPKGYKQDSEQIPFAFQEIQTDGSVRDGAGDWRTPGHWNRPAKKCGTWPGTGGGGAGGGAAAGRAEGNHPPFLGRPQSLQ